MNIEGLRDYCIQKTGVTEGFPFGNETLVFKLHGKIFLIAGLETNFFNAKCDPERAIELREQYPEIKPAYHQNKKHWNSVYTDGGLKDKVLYELIDHSYEMVNKTLPKKTQVKSKASKKK